MEHTLTFEALGTSWRIDSDQVLDPITACRIHARVESFDRTYSRFRSDSLVAEVARHAGVHRFPDDAVALFGLYRQLYECTQGAVTPLVGAALEHLGYGVGYRLERLAGQVDVPDWDDVMSINGAVVTTREPVLLDVGAAGKGLLVDLIAALLDEAGVGDYVIDASGDLIHRGTTAERVGLESFEDPGQVIGVASVTNEALCASSTSRRRWGAGLHHIVDPSTGEPTDGVLATWGVHTSCAVADGLATALFLVEPPLLAQAFDFSYVRIHRTRGLDYSTNFDGQLFT